jgi:hypothetical protein
LYLHALAKASKRLRKRFDMLASLTEKKKTPPEGDGARLREAT